MKNNDFLERALIAHRGLHDIEFGIPENSIKAFEKAIEKGYIIELDVHLTRDKEIVVFHDDDLKRLCNIDKKIKNLDYNEINNLSLLNTNSFIPKFVDVLNLVNGKVPILIELKYDNKIGLLESEIAKVLDKYTGDFAIQSFNPLSLLWFRINRRNIIRGQLMSKYNNTKMNIVKKFFLKNMLLNFFTNPHFISCDVHNTPIEHVKKIRKKRKVLGWTIKSIIEYDKYCKEYDNLICEKFI